MAATGTATFTAPSGDSKGAPDITNVALSDDRASGLVQVSVTAPGMLSIDPAAQPEVDVWLDTDRNEATGSRAGDEYMLGVMRTPTAAGWYVGHWTGSGLEAVQPSATMSFSVSGETLTWRFSKADIGSPTGMNFWVGAYTWNGDNLAAADYGPDGGTWSYDFAVKPMIGDPVTSPAKPVHGKRFVVSFPVTRSDNSAPLTIGTMICDPSVKGKVVRHAEQFANGTARLSFVVPKTAKGKLLKVTVTITAGDQSTTKIATFRIK